MTHSAGALALPSAFSTRGGGTTSRSTCRSGFGAIFSLPETQVRGLSGDVGGGFGNKTQMDAEAIPVLLSILTKRPVKWAEKRSDWLMSGPAGPGHAHEIE